MNKNKDVLNIALKGLLNRLEKTEKFVVDQAPEICKQMIYAKKLSVTMEMSAEILLIIVLPLVAILTGMKCHILYQAIHEYDTSAGVVIYGVISLISSVGTLCNISNLQGSIEGLIYLKKCPKLFLLREFKTLLGGE